MQKIDNLKTRIYKKKNINISVNEKNPAYLQIEFLNKKERKVMTKLDSISICYELWKKENQNKFKNGWDDRMKNYKKFVEENY